MKLELLKAIMVLSKNMFYLFLLQLAGLQLLFASHSSGQLLSEVELSLQLNNVTVVETFEAIKQKTGFNFVYDHSVSDLKGRFSLHYKSESLEKVLREIAGAHGLQFKRINRTISVIKSKKQKSRKNNAVIEMDRSLSGKVIDSESGEPLVGATVRVKGTTIGTVTDAGGNFTLSVPNDAEALAVSYIGYKTVEVAIGNQTSFEISLGVDVASLQEIVVYGYGTGTREKFNGAVSKVNGEDVNSFSTPNFEQSMVGRLAGVQVIQNTKNPGESSTIQVRGINTLTAGTDPLLVVDGVPLTEGTSLSSFNTRDIESIDVLKDAASSAIYGSRASNGVILITTKKGEKGKLSVTYDAYYGTNEKLDNFELVNAYDAAIFHSEARNNGYVSRDPANRSASDDNETRIANGAGKRELIPGYLQGYLDNTPGLTNTDWEDAVFRRAKQQNHYLNLSGGNEKTNYSVSLGYIDQENIVINSEFERYTNTINVNTQLNKYIRYGINLNTSFSTTDRTGNSAWANLPPDPGFAFTLMDPYYPVYNPDGSLAISVQLDDHNENWDGPISENTVAHAVFTKNFERRFRTFGSTYLEIEPLENLKFKTSFGGDYRSTFRDFFSPSFLGRYRTPIANNPATADETNITNENFLIENILTYRRSFRKHNANLLLGQSYQQESFKRTRAIGTDFVDDNLDNIAGASNFSIESSRSKWALSSLFSRLEYDYSGKYFLSAAIRRDGSSRFGSNSRYANFSSLSAGWVVSAENFFPRNNVLNFAKLRVSWGESGNNQIGDFSSQSLLEPDNYTINGQLVGGTGTDTAPNDQLSWETSTSTNFGIDLGFLDNKILLSAEYYDTNTEDLLLEVPVPQQTGFSESLQNIGELKNTGFELELKGRGLRVGNLELGFNANLATNENEVLALGEGQDQIIDNDNGVDFLTAKGGSIAQLYAYDLIGVFKTQEELDAANNDGITPLPGTQVGDYIVRDADGDGEITPDDRVTQGDYNPEFTYGFGINATYKGFDLTAQFDGIEGRKLYDRILRNAEAGEGFVVPSQYYFDNYYHPVRNPDGFLAAPNFANFSSARRATRSSNLSIHDADFFRLRSLQIGYTLPENITKPWGINRLRVYFTGNNLFNITDYRGLTSEAIRSSILTRGINRTGTPISRFLAFGLNVNF